MEQTRFLETQKVSAAAGQPDQRSHHDGLRLDDVVAQRFEPPLQTNRANATNVGGANKLQDTEWLAHHVSSPSQDIESIIG